VNPFLTKEGIEVKVGQVWRDLDYRQAGRHVCVVEVRDSVLRNGKLETAEPYAVVQRCQMDGTIYGNGTTRLAIRRMHKSSTGWALLRAAP
jgi:hypothetical protein